uniref:MFS transporter n=1 Tax=Microbispora siamensis TaxID=564413 RepID=UPI0023B31364|nr:MFS transporter [Microbispora siamensis]
MTASRTAGPGASSRVLGLVSAGGMLANVVGVPLGAFAGQLVGWRGPFWALAILAVAAAALIARTVPHDGGDHRAPRSCCRRSACCPGRPGPWSFWSCCWGSSGSAPIPC